MISKRVLVMRNFVRELSTLSKCTDKHIAAIICNKDMDQIYSIGINGGAKGGADCLCNMGQRYTCVHAEANAIAKCNTFDRHKVLFSLMGPCVTCAALIVNNGFDKVYIDKPWKNKEGEDILRAAGIEIIYVGDDAIAEAEFKLLCDRLVCNIGIQQRIERNLTDKEANILCDLAKNIGRDSLIMPHYAYGEVVYTDVLWRASE